MRLRRRLSPYACLQFSSSPGSSNMNRLSRCAGRPLPDRIGERPLSVRGSVGEEPVGRACCVCCCVVCLRESGGWTLVLLRASDLLVAEVFRAFRAPLDKVAVL